MIKIHEELDPKKCVVCNRPYPHRKRYTYLYDGDKTIKETEFVIAHAGCRNLTRKISELKSQLLNAEFELFCIHMNKETI